MSELKATTVYDAYWKANSVGEGTGIQVYLKSEADKVIAEKDEEIAELKKKLMPCLNGDCILTCEVVEKYGKENAELKKENERLKDEADKVISDLEESHKMEVEQLLMEIVELKKQVHDYGQGLYVIQAKAEMETRHQKYKRCLAMADYSMYHHFRMLEIYGKRLDNDRAVFKINFGLRWRYRWLELADKLKDKEAK